MGVSSQAVSPVIAQVPLSALSGGAGSNGIVAPINGQGVPLVSPMPPRTITPSSGSLSSAGTPSATNQSMIDPSRTLSSIFGKNVPDNIESSLASWEQDPNTISAGMQTPFSMLPPSLQTQVQGYANQNGAKRGGKVKGYAGGGIPTSEALSPWYARAEERSMIHPEGLITSTGAGRTDVHNINVPSGSYVVPADVVSGLAEGNTLSGASVMDRMMHSNPYGIQGGGGRHGSGPPRVSPPRPYQEPSPNNFNIQNRGGAIKRASGGSTELKPKEKPLYLNPRSLVTPTVDQLAKVIPQNTASTLKYSEKVPVDQSEDPPDQGTPQYGGYAQGGEAHHKGEPVPIVIAGGEFLVHPSTIIKKFGSLKKGHAAMDAFVKRVRAENVKTLRKLPGPKK